MTTPIVPIIAAQAGIAVAAAAYFYQRETQPPPPSTSSPSEPLNPDAVLKAAASIVKATRSYGFVCTTPPNPRAPPQCRVMDLHKLTDDSLEFGLISRTITRKAESLRSNSACTIAFHDPRASSEAGYLVLSGEAREIKNVEERRSLWKPSWSFFHPGPHSEEVVQWRFVPNRLELQSNLTGITDDWQPVTALKSEKKWALQPRRGAKS